MLPFIFLVAVSCLSVGEKAPLLEGTLWLKGGPPVYANQLTVLHFWATTCGACRAEIPHLKRLQAFYGDEIAVAGLSREPSSDIARYMRRAGQGPGFSIGKVPDTLWARFMEGRGAIPYAYLIDRNATILWRGPPVDLDEVIARALEGTLDITRTRRLSALEDALEQTLKGQDPSVIARAADAVLALDPANERALRVRTVIAKKEQDPAALQAVYDRIDPRELGPEKAARLAQSILEERDLAYRPVGAAFRLSAHAVKQRPENGRYAHTLARVQYALGKVEEAIRWEKRAIELDPGQRAFREALDYYLAVRSLGKALAGGEGGVP